VATVCPYAIASEQGMGRFGDPLGAFAHHSASAGGKAGHDPPSVHRTPGRLVAFSDAVSGRAGAGYRLGSERGSPNQGRTLFSKRVMAQIRSPVRVST
jgi:hypothetical protein